MDASTYLKLYIAKQKSSTICFNLCGKITLSDSMMDEHSFRRFTLVFGPEMLQSFLGLTDRQVLKIVNGGVKAKFVVFPLPDMAILATWKNLLRIIVLHYPLGVYSRIKPLFEKLMDTPYLNIDPDLRLKKIAERFSLSDRINHPEFMTEERFLKLPLIVTLYQARAFLYHSLGCDIKFRGTGESGYFIPNSNIYDIRGLRYIDISIKSFSCSSLFKWCC